MKVFFPCLSCSTIVPETRSYFAHPSFHQWWGRKGPWWTGRWCCCETSLTAPSARQSWSCGPLGCQLHLSHKHTHRHAWLTTHSPVICISTIKEKNGAGDDEDTQTHRHDWLNTQSNQRKNVTGWQVPFLKSLLKFLYFSSVSVV